MLSLAVLTAPSLRLDITFLDLRDKTKPAIEADTMNHSFSAWPGPMGELTASITANLLLRGCK